MSRFRKEFCIVEHLWRLLRAIPILLGTALWLYTDVSTHIIMVCYLTAGIVDQLHGLICYHLESILKYKHQHDLYE